MTEVTKELRPDGGVVVGDDGSENAAVAVGYAVEEAQRRGSTLHVLRAWSILSTSRPSDLPPGVAPSLEEFAASCRAQEQRRLAKLIGDNPPVPVEVHPVHAPAAEALITASETADVVVVGSRGLGGFRSLVLGSVAEQVLRHASGPVIVVRDRHA